MHKAAPLMFAVSVLFAVALSACGEDEAPDTEVMQVATPSPTAEPTPTNTPSPTPTNTPSPTPTTTPSPTPTQAPVTTPVAPPSDPGETKRYDLPGDKLFPIGIAYDPATDSFFVGSREDATILRVDRSTGDVEVFLEADPDGARAYGLAIDPDRRRLWVAGSSRGVSVYDLETGDLLERFPVPRGTSARRITVVPNGDAYATDLSKTAILRIAASQDQFGELEEWVRLPSDKVQGIASTDDGKYLIVNDRGTKLYRLEVSTKEVVEITVLGAESLSPEGLTYRMEGMAIKGRTLFAVAALNQPIDFIALGDPAILSIELDQDYLTGDLRLSSEGHDLYRIPTEIAVAGDRLLVVNSQDFLGFPANLPFNVSDVAISATVNGVPTDG